jgi:hypothetical protein
MAETDKTIRKLNYCIWMCAISLLLSVVELVLVYRL